MLNFGDFFGSEGFVEIVDELPAVVAANEAFVHVPLRDDLVQRLVGEHCHFFLFSVVGFSFCFGGAPIKVGLGRDVGGFAGEIFGGDFPVDPSLFNVAGVTPVIDFPSHFLLTTISVH